MDRTNNSPIKGQNDSLEEGNMGFKKKSPIFFEKEKRLRLLLKEVFKDKTNIVEEKGIFSALNPFISHLKTSEVNYLEPLSLSAKQVYGFKEILKIISSTEEEYLKKSKPFSLEEKIFFHKVTNPEDILSFKAKVEDLVKSYPDFFPLKKKLPNYKRKDIFFDLDSRLHGVLQFLVEDFGLTYIGFTQALLTRFFEDIEKDGETKLQILRNKAFNLEERIPGNTKRVHIIINPGFDKKIARLRKEFFLSEGKFYASLFSLYLEEKEGQRFELDTSRGLTLESKEMEKEKRFLEFFTKHQAILPYYLKKLDRVSCKDKKIQIFCSSIAGDLHPQVLDLKNRLGVSIAKIMEILVFIFCFRFKEGSLKIEKELLETLKKMNPGLSRNRDISHKFSKEVSYMFQIRCGPKTLLLLKQFAEKYKIEPNALLMSVIVDYQLRKIL